MQVAKRVKESIIKMLKENEPFAVISEKTGFNQQVIMDILNEAVEAKLVEKYEPKKTLQEELRIEPKPVIKEIKTRADAEAAMEQVKEAVTQALEKMGGVVADMDIRTMVQGAHEQAMSEVQCGDDDCPVCEMKRNGVNVSLRCGVFSNHTKDLHARMTMESGVNLWTKLRMLKDFAWIVLTWKGKAPKV